MAVQTEILSRLKPRIDKLGRTPGLAVVLVGHDPASEIYVRSKIKACAELGIYSEKITPPETATTDDLVAVVGEAPRPNRVIAGLPMTIGLSNVGCLRISRTGLPRSR